jgi:hypothetical protein
MRASRPVDRNLVTEMREMADSLRYLDLDDEDYPGEGREDK